MNTDPLRALAAEWREEAAVFRRYGEERLSIACETHADQLEAAVGAQAIEALTLEEAAEIGGYSYSHLQHLVADGEIDNVGESGAPRIRRSDVPRKPGHGKRRATSRGEALDHSLQLHRGGVER